MTPKKILAIGGHPDDVEQFMGGTLILLAKAGHDVTVAALTDGACGSHTLSAEEIVTIRKKESANAAKLLGAKQFINLKIPDGSLEYNLETTKKVVALIRDTQPDIILTHPTDDYMTDHWHTGALVLWAVPEALHENFEAPTSSPVLKKYPHVYHCDPQGLTRSDGQIPEVNTIIDITSVFDQKMKAFAAHKSQMHFMESDKKSGKDTIWKTTRWHIIRGEQSGVEYAEGFTQQLKAEYPKNNMLQTLLHNLVITI